MRDFALIGYMNHATQQPVLEIDSLAGRSLEEVCETTGDMNSKGTAYSAAVTAKRAQDFLDEEDLELLGALIGLETIGNPGRISLLISNILTAGARMALQLPDIETLLPTSK